MLNVIIGIVLVMIANVLLGASLAKLKENFNKQKMLNGIFKIVCIVLAVIFMYLCSYLNPDIMILNIRGTDINLIEGIRLIGIAGIVFYGGQSLKKLADLIKVSTAINNNKEEE